MLEKYKKITRNQRFQAILDGGEDSYIVKIPKFWYQMAVTATVWGFQQDCSYFALLFY